MAFLLSEMSNRLINEISPYLLQHAENPVNWYPWCEEAFAEAGRLDKPIFLSIGYSTCHWCHVMEKESFSNKMIAGLLNDCFVCIKVDREERPDIDSVYMNICQMLTGSGGWPLTVLMTHDKKAFFAGTYFPPSARWGKIGLTELIAKIKEVWTNERDMIYESATAIIENFENMQLSQKSELNINIVHELNDYLKFHFDSKNGGFSKPPKFPTPHILSFLMSYHYFYHDEQSLNMALRTLDAMKIGGIYDHCGYGFHRYSTDEKWLVPHFEKMLYDQASLLSAYVDAYAVTGRNIYKTTSYEIINYLKTELMVVIEDGLAFCSAEDADSEGVEGKFYVWKFEEIKRILEADAETFISIYNVTENGNCKIEADSVDDNILHLSSLEDYTDNTELIRRGLTKLYEFRKNRIRPYKDDKILTDWNSMIAVSLAKAGAVFNDFEIINLAEKTFSFIMSAMEDAKGQLFHCYREGRVSVNGLLDDFAWLVAASLQLYNSTYKTEYLRIAIDYSDKAISKFFDNEHGCFFQREIKESDELLKVKETYDGAYLSGNTVVIENLLKLWKITGNEKYYNILTKCVGFLSSRITQYPAGYSGFLSTFLLMNEKTSEIVVTNFDEKQMQEINTILKSKYSPGQLILYKTEKHDFSGISEWIAQLEIDGSKIYICSDNVCKLPLKSIEELRSVYNSQEQI